MSWRGWLENGCWYVHKLIFVDGIMGSGKPTTAKFVAEELERSGTPVRLIDENFADHPVQMADPEEFESIDVWMTERLFEGLVIENGAGDWDRYKSEILQFLQVL